MLSTFAFTRGKTASGNANEDGLVLTSHCLAVVDGATAKGPQLYEGKLSGEFAMHVVLEALAQTHPAESAYHLVARVTEVLRDEVLRVTGRVASLLEPALRPSASFVAFLPHTRELVFVGDCHALVDNKSLGFGQPFEPIVSRIRANYFVALREQGVPEADLLTNYQDRARALIAPAIHWGAELRNQAYNPLSFSVIDGTEVPPGLIHVVKLFRGPHVVVLASDGYPQLFPTFEETEEWLQAQLLADPLCVGPLEGCKGVVPGNVSFDDRSFLAFEIE